MRNHFYENDFDLHENETACRTHFHMKGFALRLVLKQRNKRTRKWPIRNHPLICWFMRGPMFQDQHSLVILLFGMLKLCQVPLDNGKTIRRICKYKPKQFLLDHF